MKSILTMRYPAAWHGEMWREAAPCGNGLIGASVYGSVDREYILLNHAHLWRGGRICVLPDVHAAIDEVRRRLDNERPDLADDVIADALRREGYDPDVSVPYPLCDIRIDRESEKPIYGYSRTVDMTKAEVTVSWTEDDALFTRSTFVSRADNLCYTKISCTSPEKISVAIYLDTHDRETMGRIKPILPESLADDEFLYYSADNESAYKVADGSYGAAARVISSGGSRSVSNNMIRITCADEVTVVTGVYVGENRDVGLQKAKIAALNGKLYDEALNEHITLHRELYDGVEFSISDTETPVEEMLIDAYSNGASNELLETMYAFGRYLFVCSTGTSDGISDDTEQANKPLPTHLTGLWNGTYQCFWAIHMFNVNFEMIYWQALSGNQPELLKTALLYIESMIDDFRENARKIYGCRGIYVDSVNTPESGRAACIANHIINWTAGAAWISEHFYDYYRYTGDIDFLRDHAVPFMTEAALFYEDFLRVRENGRYEFAPSTSPENTPSNVLTELHSEAQTSKNAAMDIAAVRELLTNLLEASDITGMCLDKRSKWMEMLELLPEYKYNDDGSLKEWADDFYKDQNSHRHQSHLYGVFPGHSIKYGTREYEGCKISEENRLKFGLKAQSSWSAVFMAGVNARLGNGEISWLTLSEMVRNCAMGNLFTVHNDWRRTGSVSCNDFRAAPFQIDANIGFTAVVNEMLVRSSGGDICLLPALPDKWDHGKISGIRTVGGHTVNIDFEKNKAVAVITGGFAGRVAVYPGSGWKLADCGAHGRIETVILPGEKITVNMSR